MNYARRLDRRAALRKQRRSAVKDQIRRGLLAERLEERSLLAADVLSPFTASSPSVYWNADRPTDVNRDGFVAPSDALAIINKINSNGSYQLPQVAGAEGEGGITYFVDVNNDGWVSPADALEVINRINSGESEPDSNDKVTYTVQALDPTSGNPITSIKQGEDFILQILARDLRQPAEGTYDVYSGDPPNRNQAPDPNNPGEFLTADYKRGVSAAYMDLLYTKADVNVRTFESQTLTIPQAASGSFTLSLGAVGPTGAINFANLGTTAGRNATRDAIAAAMNLPTFLGPNSVTVAASTSGTAPNQNAVFRIDFSGELDVDEPLVTVGGPNAGSVTPAESVAITSQAAFFRAFDFNELAGFANGLSANNDGDRIGSLGSGPSDNAVPVDNNGEIPAVEVVRVRMRAADLQVGVSTLDTVFTPNFDTLVYPAFDTLVFGNATQIEEKSKVNPGDPGPADSEIDAPAFVLTITSGPYTANPDPDTVINEDLAAPGVAINVLDNDATDPSTATKELVDVQPASVAPAGAGTVTKDGNQVRFVPAPNFFGTATFTYTARIFGDTVSDPATGNVTVTVNPVDDAPTLDAIAPLTIDEDAATVVPLTGIGTGGGPLEDGLQTITSIVATSDNTSLIANPITVIYTDPSAIGSLNFTPVANQSGTATITVTVTDSGSTTNTFVRTFTVTVSAVNDAPANNLAGTPITGATPPQFTSPGAPLTFNNTNANLLTVADVDAGAATVQVALSLGAGQGTLKLSQTTGLSFTFSDANGTGLGDGTDDVAMTFRGTIANVNAAINGLIYAPAAGFVSTATLTIASNDLGATGSGGALTTTSNLSILLDPGVRPFAVNDGREIDEGSTAVLTIDALGNDFTDPTLTTTIITVNDPPTGQGTADIVAGQIEYTPPGGDFFTPNTPVQFTYTISDGVGTDSIGTVSINIKNVPDAPIASNDNYGIAIGETLVVSDPAQGVLQKGPTPDKTVDNDFGNPNVAILTVLNPGVRTTTGGGSVTIAANGMFTYTPAAAFLGNDTFTYKAHSSLGPDSADATVTIKVSSPPVAKNDSYDVLEQSASVQTQTSVALDHGNGPDADPTENRPLTYELVNNIANTAQGQVVFRPDGTFDYIPETAANFNTTRPPAPAVTFTYRARANDGTPSNIATVSLRVQEVNDNPTVAPDEFTAVRNNGTVGIDQPIEVLANDGVNDPDVQEVRKVTAVTGVTTATADASGNTAPVATTGGGSVRLSNFQILYTSPTTTGGDSFSYTASDFDQTSGTARGGSANATVTVSIVDFVPKTVSGTVFMDSDNDGVIYAGESFIDSNGNARYDAGESFTDSVGGVRDNNTYDPPERRLSGVEVRLTGTDFLDAGAASIVDLIRFTDENGNYSFAGIKPPKASTNYTLTEIQPAYLLSGIDRNSSVSASAALVINANTLDNLFTMAWGITDSTGNVTGLNFGEKGVNFASLSDSSGFLSEFLASSGSSGFVIAADLTGDTLWSFALPGWEGVKNLQVTLDPSLTSLTISGSNMLNPVVLHTRMPIPGDGFPAGSQARFRILGIGQNGQYIIRIDASLEDCGVSLVSAAPAVSGAEGESAAQYAESADAVFAESAWA